MLLLPAHSLSICRRTRLATVLTVLLLGAAFAAAHGQDALYSGNQVTYLLKPYADAGHGFLSNDWLAGTAERMPAMSMLVRLTVDHLDERLLHLYHALLIGAYGFALAGLGAFAMREATPGRMWAYLLVIFAVHVDGGWKLLTAGVAGQSATHQVFEPAVFGTLLVLSLYLFARERHLLSVACLAAAATAHPTYLLPGVAIAALYAGVTLRRDGKARLAAAELGLYVLAVAPTAIYTFVTFWPQSASLHAQASAILANRRIPYHTDPNVWFHEADLVRIALILVAIFVVRRTRLAPVMTGLVLIGAGLTAARVLFGSLDLGLLFPWRVSVLLVPAATAVVAATVVERAFMAAPGWLGRRDRFVAGLGLLLVTLTGAARLPRLVDAIETRASDAEPISSYVARSKRPDDVFLVPVGTRLTDIAAWDAFRLRTGAPIYVDLKSHPLRDSEVVEWWSRVRIAQQLYRPGFPPCQGVRFLRRTAGVSAVIVSSVARVRVSCPDLQLVYRDPSWSLYRFPPDRVASSGSSRPNRLGNTATFRGVGPSPQRWPCDRCKRQLPSAKRQPPVAPHPTTTHTARARTSSRSPATSEQSANASVPPTRSTRVRDSIQSPGLAGLRKSTVRLTVARSLPSPASASIARPSTKSAKVASRPPWIVPRWLACRSCARSPSTSSSPPDRTCTGPTSWRNGPWSFHGVNPSGTSTEPQVAGRSRGSMPGGPRMSMP